MKMIKTTAIVAILTAFSATAFAASPDANHTPTQTVHMVKAPVLIDANPYGTTTKTRRIVRVVKKPVDTPIARDASMSADSQFVFKYGKNTNTKTFRPSNTATASMPNKFKK